MAKTIIGCRLPHGIVLEHPANPAKTVEIDGLNKAVIIGAEYTTTAVEDSFWDEWKAANGSFPALLNGAIFEAKSQNDASAVFREVKEMATGFEPMSPTDAGVKPAEQ